MTRMIVTVDLGGTHARFALSEVDCGRVVSLGEAVTLQTRDHASFQSAWRSFGEHAGGPIPRGVAIAIAAPIRGAVIRLTNNPWTIRPALIRDKLDVDDYTLINDFGAVAHAVAQGEPRHFVPLCGPKGELPPTGRISIVGPGTGLGVAHVGRSHDGYHVQATEGGHIDFAPIDIIDDAILTRIRKRHNRVSAERVVSGPAIVDIYETLAAMEGKTIPVSEDRTIWKDGLDGSDTLAVAAIDRFCMSLGSVAGDIALAQGGSAVVIAGGLGLRIEKMLRQSGFANRFRAKGRFERMMAEIPVKLITHPEPGLLGAAAAFAQEHR